MAQFEVFLARSVAQGNDVARAQSNTGERTVGVTRTQVCPGEPRFHVKTGGRHFAAATITEPLLVPKTGL
jgi:hypothetical protein